MASAKSTETYDYAVIGSGFGGAVSAMRLGEKGYRVLVMERGKRYEDDDLPRINWNLGSSLCHAGMGRSDGEELQRRSRQPE